MPQIAEKPGVLFIVATPIGNFEDITLRALKVLSSVDAVVCEELREGSSLLKKLGITGHELVTLNEHNEKSRIPELISRLWQGQSLALISDCGTPVFADPGSKFLAEVVLAGIKTIPVPGPSSLMAALSILDLRLDKFIFAGFLPRQSELRTRELMKLREMRMPVVLMDTPYRLQTLLAEVQKVFGPGQSATLAANLTLPGEHIYRGRIKEISNDVQGSKAEFILILHK